MAIGGLGRAAMAPAIVSNHSIAALEEKQHLSIPIVRRKRPSVMEHDRLAGAPILVIDLCSVFGFEERKNSSSFCLGGFVGCSSAFRAGGEDGRVHSRCCESSGFPGQHVS